MVTLLREPETATRQTVTDVDPDAPALIPIDTNFGDEGAFLDASHPNAAWRFSHIVAALIADDPEALGHLQTASFRCMWQRQGGKAAGVQVLAKAVRPGKLQRFLAGEVDFFIIVASDFCREVSLTNRQMEALVYSKLLCCDVDPETGKPAIRPPEFSGFIAEIDRYGWWSAELRGAVNAFRQMRLFGERDER